MGKVIVIGSGFAGLSAACFLAQNGAEVVIIEKNEQAGGRARAFTEQGFTFDMGPSWYWMPDVFERFFSSFGHTTADFYQLVQLDPSYQVIWTDSTENIPAGYQELRQLFERIEPGAAHKLDLFMKEAAFKYNTSMQKLVYKPGLSVREFATWDVAKSLFKIDLFGSIHHHVRKYFSNPKLLQLAEFPILFLGALPQNTPALYSLMNYADMRLGTWYPVGGMVQIVLAMKQLAERLGVVFRFGENVNLIETAEKEITKVVTDKGNYNADAVIAACDYHHAEQLLPENKRNYNERYWNSRSMAPSCLLYYIGLNRKIDGLQHHNLFFDAPFMQHAGELYTNPKWPTEPLMYVCCTSKTDETVAPAGQEQLFVLIPVAPGMEDTPAIRDYYYDVVMKRLEQKLGASIKDLVIYKRSYAHNDFVKDYNAYKGNAYGLANTLQQTAIMKPSIRNHKLKNMFYTGQLTVPGPGVPPAIISGEIVANQVLKSFKIKTV